jgi:hypothetical protein
MSSTADQLAALGNDSNFRARVQALAQQYAAGTVYLEDHTLPTPAIGAIRLGFARTIINGGGGNIAAIIANSTNLVAGNTTYDFSTSHVKTDVTDAAISSQISSDWNMLAGV